MTRFPRIRCTGRLAALLVLSLGAGLVGWQVTTQAISSGRIAYAAEETKRAQQLIVPADVELIRDVEFGKGGGRPLKLDILRPKDLPKEPVPVIVFVHGGGWSMGRKEGGIQRLVPLAEHGYFCATIEYRLNGEAVFPAQIEDCKCAIRFLRAKAEEYNIDPNRIGAWGTSAGGHLVALLGTSGGVKELEGKGGWAKCSSRVQAVCDFFGPADLLSLAEDAGKNKFRGRAEFDSKRNAVAILLGGPIEENKDKAAKASPITYVSKDDPPFLICHGDQDELVPIRQSERLCEALEKVGVEANLHVIKGAAHGVRDAEVDKLVVDFFDKHLRGGTK